MANNNDIKLEIEYLPLSELTPYENNARKHGVEDVEKIKNSILEFDFCDPIGIWGKNNIIVEGHGRLQALMQLGKEKAPCIRLDHLTDEQRKAYALAHNQTALLSDWDLEKLTQELSEIDLDMSDFGFDDMEIEQLDPEVVEDEVPESAEQRCQKGDIWKLGNHRLMCCDSTDINAVSVLMGEKKADMVFTDPPYNVEIVGGFHALPKTSRGGSE